MTKKAKNKIRTNAKSKPFTENTCHTMSANAHKKALSTLNKMTKADVFWFFNFIIIK